MLKSIISMSACSSTLRLWLLHFLFFRKEANGIRLGQLFFFLHCLSLLAGAVFLSAWGRVHSWWLQLSGLRFWPWSVFHTAVARITWPVHGHWLGKKIIHRNLICTLQFYWSSCSDCPERWYVIVWDSSIGGGLLMSCIPNAWAWVTSERL